MSVGAVARAHESELDASILDASRVAVIATRWPPDPWLDELVDAIERGRFTLPRTTLRGVSLAEVTAWLERTVPRDVVSTRTRDALISDLLDQVHRQEALWGSTRFVVRVLVEAPSRRCGFHVDTVPRGAPAWGLLRVYNGRGPSWVDPRDVTSMRAFYDWLAVRDRIVRDHADVELRDARLRAHDEDLSFLAPGASVHELPAGTTVAFRHLEAHLHWSDHEPQRAWIHSSPMAGRPRLVVNVSSDGPVTLRPQGAGSADPRP
ncbi:MAG: hypothetical protein KDK70_40060, partial [Myxococcales bacterium]|nr:hypothetical protein [Myxococcales bacterium]